MFSTDELVALGLWVAASSVALGVVFSAVTLLTRHLSGERLAFLVGAASAVVVAFILASRDDIALGGHVVWRLAVFGGALGAGYLALGAVVQRRPRIVTLKEAAVVCGFAAAAFSVVGAAALVLLVVISVAFA